MKKILLILPFLAAISCVHPNQKVALNFDLNNQSSSIGSNKSIEVSVFDERVNKSLLGRKKFSAEEIEINADVNVAAFLQQKIMQNLSRRGFKNGHDKIVEIHIETLSYMAKRGYPVGSSKIDARLKVMVQDSKTGAKFIKNYGTSWDSKHFIVPLEATDGETINALLRDVTQEIVSDDSFLESLVK